MSTEAVHPWAKNKFVRRRYVGQRCVVSAWPFFCNCVTRYSYRVNVGVSCMLCFICEVKDHVYYKPVCTGSVDHLYVYHFVFGEGL